ncbi:hypothetical protein CHS0354_002816 [Potamilus streckersoni]|uniref:Uncharacterized protein n=1 Tax=Potamilus streckersoni TaxID=2493646 RepID=A0AAE0RMP0_9BIVA|nr:hypothetical protein CHS0354_002816 [Potamilus streckersoni]
MGNRDYDIRPAETDVTPRNVLDVPGQFGKRYILQDQAHIPGDTSSVEQEFMALYQRFEGRQNQKHLFPSDVVLSSINATTVNNRAAAGAKRNSERIKE